MSYGQRQRQRQQPVAEGGASHARLMDGWCSSFAMH